jgi:hypothetical protein
MSRDIHVHIPERQYDFLRNESSASGLPMAELIRRAIDYAYRSDERSQVRGWQASFGWWKHPDAAVVGRRAGSRV